MQRFDAIVVGAGPAGNAAAISLAKKGARVLCLERGEYPGVKNVSGGVLYGDLLKELIAGDAGEAPLERKIARHVIAFASEENLITFSHQHVGDEKTAPCFSVLRNKFDSWLSRQAEKTGVRVLTEAVVDDIIWKDGRTVGVTVRRPEGDVFADLVILADGVNSLLSKKAGLRQDFQPAQMILAVKEVLKLPKEVIESRFNLKEEGVAYLMVGETTEGLEGGGFLYTNRKSLSLGLACHMNALIREKVKIHDLLERFKQIKWISEFIEGGTLKEYSAHLIPIIGFKERPRIVTDGILVVGDAAGLTLNNGFVLRGMDFALASGMAAAETGMEALNRGDFSYKTLKAYEERLKNSFVLKDLETFQRAKDIMKNRALYATYPALLGDVFADIFNITGKPKEKIMSLLWNRLRQRKASASFIKDCLKMGRSI